MRRSLPSARSSSQASSTVWNWSSPSEFAMCPVTVSASTSRTRWSRRTWSVVARLIEIVVLPTPPFGLKITTIDARFVQAAESRPLSDSMIGPVPVIDGVRPDEHRLDPPAERIGAVGPGEVLVVDRRPRRRPGQLLEVARRDDHERRDVPAGLVEERVVLERLVEVALAVEDGQGEVTPRVEQAGELLRRPDSDHVVARCGQLPLNRGVLVGRQGDGDRLAAHRRAEQSGGAGPSPRTRDRARSR